MQVENWNIGDVKPYERNPRKNDDAVEYVANSIKEFGFQQPLVVDKDGVLIVGHTRLKAAKKLGLKEVPVVVADNLTDEQVKAYRLADNKTNEFAEWDFSMLNDELADIDWLELDMSQFGFKLDDELFGEAEEDDYTEDDASAAPSRAQRGDIWQLGEHRLMCGDSTSETDVESLIDGNRADICFTSPPYNVRNGFHENEKMNDYYIQEGGVYQNYSDNLSDDEYADFLTHALGNAMAVCDDVLFNIGYTRGALMGTARFLGDNAKFFGGGISWIKSNAFTPNFDVQHGVLTNISEPIYIFNEEGQRKLHHPQWSKSEQSKNTISTENASNNEYADIHGATFPVALASEAISRFTESSVLDLFGGTGTTLIAAEQLGRKCYMMELDPHYCDVIIDRWEKLTGYEAVKVA